MSPGPPSRTVLVRETEPGQFLQQLRVGPHQMAADEPEALGGQDAGPNPYEFVLMGLGACTGMTLRMYAKLKDIPLQGVEVRLELFKIHAEDCADCMSPQGTIDEIHREITLIGDLSEVQQDRLLQIANRCPVHRLLSSEVRIRSRLSPPRQVTAEPPSL